MNISEFLNSAKRLEKEITENRRWLHSNAEVGFELEKTAPFVKEKLCDMGYDVTPCGKNGLTATIGEGDKVFLLRADMDALPVKEESGLDFASGNGNAHPVHDSLLFGSSG